MEKAAPMQKGVVGAGDSDCGGDQSIDSLITSSAPSKGEGDRSYLLIAGEYQIGQVIGKGQHATVHRALNLCTGEIVAVKRFEIANITKRALANIMVEADVLKRLDHPNIVHFHGYMKTKEHLFFVMEYVDEGALSGIIRDFGVLGESVCATYTAQLLLGLSYLHQNSIIHRDIKGGNILITKSGDAKLADFGVSASVDHTDHRLSVVGSPYWMAPECIALAGHSLASDIWSVACVCIEMLQGEPFHYQLSAMAAMYKIVEEPVPPLPSGISNEFSEVLRSCFSKQPAERPTATALLQDPYFKSVLERSKVSPRISQKSAVNTLQPTTTLLSTLFPVTSSESKPPSITAASASSPVVARREVLVTYGGGSAIRDSLVFGNRRHDPSVQERGVITSLDELKTKLQSTRRVPHPDELASQQRLAQLIPQMAKSCSNRAQAAQAVSSAVSIPNSSSSVASDSSVETITLHLPHVRPSVSPPSTSPPPVPLISSTETSVASSGVASTNSQPLSLSAGTLPPLLPKWSRVDISFDKKKASPQTSPGRESIQRPLSSRGASASASPATASILIQGPATPDLTLSKPSSANTSPHGSKIRRPAAAPSHSAASTSPPQSRSIPSVSSTEADSHELNPEEALAAVWAKTEETYAELSRLLEDREEELNKVRHDRDKLRIRYTEEAVQKNEAIALAFWALKTTAPISHEEIERRLRALADNNRHHQHQQPQQPLSSKKKVVSTGVLMPQLTAGNKGSGGVPGRPAVSGTASPPIGHVSSPAPAAAHSPATKEERVVTIGQAPLRPSWATSTSTESPKPPRSHHAAPATGSDREKEKADSGAREPRIPTWTKKTWL